MTNGSFDRRTRLRLTWNALMAERFVWRPLLREFVDLAAAEPGFEAVSDAAARLLRAVDGVAEAHDVDA